MSDHPYVAHEWSVAHVDAIRASLDQFYAVAATILARANFSSASRGCRPRWPTSTTSRASRSMADSQCHAALMRTAWTMRKALRRAAR